MFCEAIWLSSAIVPNANSTSTRLWSATRVTNFLYKIRPGVTSYATLYNGYTDTIEKMLRRLELDLYYLEHQSMWFDTKVLFKTFISIVFGKKF